MVSDRRRPVLAVIGDGGPSPEVTAGRARALGRLAIDAGFRLVTGGLEGVMRAASEGARESEAYREGDVVAIVPGYDRGEANSAADLVIATGLGHARNVLVVASADVVIAVGGRAGTLSEIALAWKLGKPIVALADSGGWAKRLAGQSVDERGRDPILSADTPEAAVAAATRLADGRG